MKKHGILSDIFNKVFAGPIYTLTLLQNALRENKGDLNNWRHSPCSQIGRLDVGKMSLLAGLMHGVNTISIKIPVSGVQVKSMMRHHFTPKHW